MPERSAGEGASPILGPSVLAVEGNDEENFFRTLFAEHEITNVSVELLKGIDNLRLVLAALMARTGFEEIQALGIVRDADSSAASAFQSVAAAVTQAGLKAAARPSDFSKGSPRVGIFIVPDNTSAGMLEDLCLRSVTGDPLLQCADCYLECVAKLGDPPLNPAKARAQAYLAGKPHSVPSIGVAALKHYWDYGHVDLQPIVEFCRQLSTIPQEAR